MQFKIYVRIKNGTKKLFPKSKYYTGKKAWNFNPRQSIVGYLVLPDGINFKKRLEIQVRAEATDGVYLPHGYTWLPFQNEFYLEPSTDFEE